MKMICSELDKQSKLMNHQHEILFHILHQLYCFFFHQIISRMHFPINLQWSLVPCSSETAPIYLECILQSTWQTTFFFFVYFKCKEENGERKKCEWKIYVLEERTMMKKIDRKTWLYLFTINLKCSWNVLISTGVFINPSTLMINFSRECILKWRNARVISVNLLWWSFKYALRVKE